MVIKPIKNKRDYQQALATIDKLMDAKPNTPDGDRLDVLATQWSRNSGGGAAELKVATLARAWTLNRCRFHHRPPSGDGSYN
jgi:hypothetical protein